MHRRRAVVACPPVIYYSEDAEQESFVKNRLLGYGGFAAVYEVERVSDGCRMAAKVLPLSSLADANKLRRVQNEIDINQLLHHPHVVTFLGSFQDEHNVYLLQELCCITLSELLKHVGRMSELQAAHILWQVISALEHLHGCRVAHRDLKLSNMFLARDGTVKVGDLGLACHLPTPSSRRHSTCGSLNWMAPEVLQPGQAGYGLEVDIWALGVMLFTLLVGRPPFAVRNSVAGAGDAAGAGGGAEDSEPQNTCSRILQGRYRMPGPDEVALGPEVRDLVARLLAVDPAARPSLQQLRAHPFFQVHLGAFALSAAPLGLHSGASPWQLPQEQQQLERGGSSVEDRVLIPSASLTGGGSQGLAAVDAESAPRRYSSLYSPSLSQPAALDIRRLLCEAGLAALAAVAAGGTDAGARDSTSGSYMDLSQSEQCSVVTAASTTTTATATAAMAGRADAKWQMEGHETLSAHLSSRSHDPSSVHFQSHYPTYRMSDQITGMSSLQPQPKPPQVLSRLFARGSVPSSGYHDRSVSISGTETGCGTPFRTSFTQGTCGTSPVGAVGGAGGISGISGSSASNPPPSGGRVLACADLTAGQLAQELQPQNPFYACQAQHSHQSPRPNQHPQPQRSPAPRHDAPQLLQLQLPSFLSSESSKALPGGGADQELPPQGTDWHPAHSLLASPGGRYVAAADQRGAAARSFIHAPGHVNAPPPSVNGGGTLSSPHGCESPFITGASSSTTDGPGLPDRHAWGRSYNSLSTHPSTQLSSRSASQRSSAQAAGCAQEELEVHHHHHHHHQLPLAHGHQRQLHADPPQHSLRSPPTSGLRRRTIDSSIPLGAVDAMAADMAADPPGADTGGDSSTATMAEPMAPALTALRGAFLSQYSSRNHAAAHARRLQASRSAHARDSMRIAAGMRSGGMDGGADEPENDGSSDKSYADSLEAMLLGGNGRQAAGGLGGSTGCAPGPVRCGPAPVTTSGYARHAQIQPLGMAISPGRASVAPPAPSVPIGSIVLRHARTSIGAGSSQRCGGAATPSVAVGAVTPLMSMSMRSSAAARTSWSIPAGANATALRSAPCVGMLGSGPPHSDLLSSGTSGVDTAAAAAAVAAATAAATAGSHVVAPPTGVKSLPAALDTPCLRLPVALPQYQYLGQQGPSSSPPGRHSSSANTTPPHSEPLSLAVFAIPQSKGLPTRGQNSPSQGADAPVLDPGLCICSAADSSLQDSRWSSGQHLLRSAGAAAMSMMSTGVLDDAAAALEAERAVAGLHMSDGYGNGGAWPSTSVGARNGAQRELQLCQDCGRQLQQPRGALPGQQGYAGCRCDLGQALLSGNAGAGGGGHCGGGCPCIKATGTWPRNQQQQQPGPFYAADRGGAMQSVEGASCAKLGPMVADPGENVGTGLSELLQERCTQVQQRVRPAVHPHRACGCLQGSAQAGQERQVHSEDRDHAQLRQQQQQQQQQQQRQQQQQQETQPSETAQQERQQERPRSYGELGFSFTFRTYMHPWRAMALTRLRQEAMQLQRLQREEAETVALGEWSRGAAPPRPLVALAGAPAPASFHNTDAAPGREAPLPGVAGDSKQWTAPATAPVAASPSDATAQDDVRESAASALEQPWRASANFAKSRASSQREGCTRAASANAGTVLRSMPRKPRPSARLSFCCPLLPGSGGVGIGTSPTLPCGPSLSPHDNHRHAGGEAGRSSRRFTSLDVERVLRHLESNEPDDGAGAQCPNPAAGGAPPRAGCASAAAAATTHTGNGTSGGGGGTAAAAMDTLPAVVMEAAAPDGGVALYSTQEERRTSSGPASRCSTGSGSNLGGTAAGAAAVVTSVLCLEAPCDRVDCSAARGKRRQLARSDERSGDLGHMEVMSQTKVCGEEADSGDMVWRGVAAAAAEGAQRPCVPAEVKGTPAAQPTPTQPPPAVSNAWFGAPAAAVESYTVALTGPASPPPLAPRGRASVSATGMTAVWDWRSNGVAPGATPEMDPDALAQLASRLRSKSFKDGLGSRNGSYTYRPSRMMPAAQRSPSRQVAAVGGGGGGAASPATVCQPALPGDEAISSSGATALVPGVAGALTSGQCRATVHPKEVLMVKWLDYSSKYGLSYMLSNGAVGVLFRDGTQVLRDRGNAVAWLLGAPAGPAAASTEAGPGTLLQSQPTPPKAQPLLLLEESEGAVAGTASADRQHDVSKKLRLLRTFEGMLSGMGRGDGAASADATTNDEVHPWLQHREPGGRLQRSDQEAGSQHQQDGASQTATPSTDPPSQPPSVFVTWWTRTKKALVLCMSSGTLQALFCDGSELVVRETEDEVEYLARDGRRTSCSLRAARLAGPKNSLSKRIQYATMLVHSRPAKNS